MITKIYLNGKKAKSVIVSYIYHQLRVCGPSQWLGNLTKHVHHL